MPFICKMSLLQALPQFPQLSRAQYLDMVYRGDLFSYHYVGWMEYTEGKAALFYKKMDCVNQAIKRVPEQAFALIIVRHYMKDGKLKHDVQTGAYVVEHSQCRIRIYKHDHVLVELLKEVPQFDQLSTDQYLDIVRQRDVYSYYYIKENGQTESGGGLHFCRDSAETRAVQNVPPGATQLKVTRHFYEHGFFRQDLDLASYAVKDYGQGIRIYNNERELFNSDINYVNSTSGN